MSAPIRQEDFIQSIADAFQFISYYHPLDYITALGEAYEREESPAAKDAIAQILTNSRMSAEGHRPICQDTGIALVFLKVGMNLRWEATLSVQDMVNEGVRRAYGNPDNPLRASVLADPAGARKNTKDNTPAVVHFELVPGHHVEVICAAKGGGSEAKSKFAMLNPSDDLVDWVLKKIPEMGAGWCPPGIIGIGIGGTPEKAMLLAKESIMAPVDIHELKAKAATGAKLTRPEELRLELMEKINALGVGAQGLGGLTTVLDVKVLDYPCHAANLPVALVPNCAATRHCHFHRFVRADFGSAVATVPCAAGGSDRAKRKRLVAGAGPGSGSAGWRFLPVGCCPQARRPAPDQAGVRLRPRDRPRPRCRGRAASPKGSCSRSPACRRLPPG